MTPMGRIAAAGLLLTTVMALGSQASATKPVVKLQIGVKKRVDNCDMKSRNGDVLSMHYTGKLHSDGTEFDSSIPRGDPFMFTLGQGQVIRGWDRGLIGMCVGEVRKLVVPADMGYGSRGAPPSIPPNAALVFDVELLHLERRKDPSEEL